MEGEENINIEVDSVAAFLSGQILREMLKEIGADGLCNPIEECGCPIDDLAPCGCINLDECAAAVRKRNGNFIIMERCGLITA
jgi:hypothetical protein